VKQLQLTFRTHPVGSVGNCLTYVLTTHKSCFDPR